MAIQNYCLGCKNANPLDAKQCRKCGATFTKDNRKFRIDVSVKGQRITRMADSLSLAREIEAAIKSDLIREEFDVTQHKAKKMPMTLAQLWEKYLPWAQQNKKSWIDDLRYYRKHLETRFGSKPLAGISAFDLEKLKGEMKEGGERSRQTLCRSNHQACSRDRAAALQPGAQVGPLRWGEPGKQGANAAH